MDYKNINIEFKKFDQYTTSIINNFDNGRFFVDTHWHDSLELIYCVFGKLIVKINSKIHPITANQVVLINSGQFHSIDSNSSSHAIVLHIKLSAFGSYSNLIRSYIFNTDEMDSRIETLFKFRKLIEEARIYEIENHPLVEFKANICINKVIFLLLEEFRLEGADYQSSLHSQKYIPVILKITNYINENYNKEISMESVATHFSYSPSYFSRFFKKYTKLSFSDYLRNIRLGYSYYDLVEAELSINEIAEKHGFPNPRSFTVAFKEKYGLSPKVYINSIKNTEG
jgi:AraC-like DNA-binding protein